MAMIPNPKSRALLVDVTRCIGCRSCAKACKESHGFPGNGEETELDAVTYTVVLDKGNDRYLRRMCMHCADPSCAGACPVGALTKTTRARSSTTRRSASAAATAWWPAPSACPGTSGRSRCRSCASATCAASGWRRASRPPAPRPARPGPPSGGSARSCSREAQRRIAAEPRRLLTSTASNEVGGTTC